MAAAKETRVRIVWAVHRVRMERTDRSSEGLEIARVLGHLLRVEQQVAIRAEAAGPHGWRENGSVVVKAEGEVVLDEVLAGDTQVEGVPELELVLHALHHISGDSASLWDGLPQEDGIPHFLQHVQVGEFLAS